jgi:hypothetical protein
VKQALSYIKGGMQAKGISKRILRPRGRKIVSGEDFTMRNLIVYIVHLI